MQAGLNFRWARMSDGAFSAFEANLFSFCIIYAKMKEDHTLADLKKKWFSGPCLSDTEHEAMWNGVPYLDSARKAISSLVNEKAVSLRRFGAPLILLLIGVLLSSIALGVEIVWSRRYGQVR